MISTQRKKVEDSIAIDAPTSFSFDDSIYFLGNPRLLTKTTPPIPPPYAT
jgi:hypothetical protein